eukprot:COSAG02_NODE_550_length_20437_cov_4.270676_3_plen_40_part_00
MLFIILIEHSALTRLQSDKIHDEICLSCRRGPLRSAPSP